MEFTVAELQEMLKKAKEEARGKYDQADIEKAKKCLEILGDCKKSPAMKVIITRLEMFVNNEHYTRAKK